MKPNCFPSELLDSAFECLQDHGNYPKEGLLYQIPPEMATGYYWIYVKDQLFDIKIHDFYYNEDTIFELPPGNWPNCLNIAYYKSVSGEELSPYRHLKAGCIKTFFGGSNEFRCLFHKKIPLRSISIEIFPDYYETYLKEMYPTDYMDPVKAFHSIDQTEDFPEMVALLTQIWNYKGQGMAAHLFYEAKVAEAVCLMIDYSRKNIPDHIALSTQDQEAITNVASYIHDHFSSNITLAQLSHISCMSTTKLKTTFKRAYHCTITQYIKERRISHAENLLTTTDLNIEQIAIAVGYGNSGRFAAVFKESCGLFPSDYKKSAQS